MHLAVWIIGGLACVGALVAFLMLRRLRGHSPDADVLDKLPEDLRKRIPVSLHPVIDPAKCIGSRTCIAACPEGRILKLYQGSAHLAEPESCIGHGMCAKECPVGAIELVFGTAERGIDIPHVSEHFETNVPGISIAGELGGMGLIRNAVSQGVQAVEHITRQGASKDPEVLDLLIVGAGPAGLAGALTAREQGLSYLIIDQEETIGGTIAHYPRRKVVMLGDLQLPGFRRVKATEITKEELMAVWTEAFALVADHTALGERLEGLVRGEDKVIAVTTDKRTLRARHVLLAVGRRGTPRQLGVPGEELPKVAYSLREPEAFEGARIMVVGGGDSAIEAALALAEQPGTEVGLSYRGDTIFRAKTKNRKRIEAAFADGTVTPWLSTQVMAVSPDAVALVKDGAALRVDNDQVFVFAGGILPTKLLESAGITMERKFGSR